VTPRRWLLTAFGIGRFPHAPGSLASLVTFSAVVLAQWLAHSGAIVSAVLGVFGTLVTLLLGSETDSRGGHDPAWIVTDEVAGQALACAGVVAYPFGPAWMLPFLLFRVLDVWKPGPIRKLERLPGGAGVLCDDLAAGLVAGLVSLGAAAAWSLLRA
jgi:phosphatidylglycerophosphatase A